MNTQNFRFVTPTAQQIKNARLAAGLTQSEAALSCGMSVTDPATGRGRTSRTWIAYESADRVMPASTWAIFLLATGQHPELRIVHHGNHADVVSTRPGHLSATCPSC
jgi:hypothetical protein